MALKKLSQAFVYKIKDNTGSFLLSGPADHLDYTNQ